jgi:hypothetical protein
MDSCGSGYNSATTSDYDNESSCSIKGEELAQACDYRFWRFHSLLQPQVQPVSGNCLVHSAEMNHCQPRDMPLEYERFQHGDKCALPSQAIVYSEVTDDIWKLINWLIS